MKIVIEGAGEVGSHLAKMLRAEANEVTVIDDNRQRLEKLASYADVATYEGRPTSINTLKEAGVDKADLFIAVVPSATQEVNIVGALLAKHLGAAKVVARVNDVDYFDSENKLMFKEMGIELMFYPEKIASDEIVDKLRNATFGETMEFANGKLQIATFKLDEDSPLLDVSLKDFIKTIPYEDTGKFRIIAVSRENETMVPNLNTVFQYGDIIYTISQREGVESLVYHFGKKFIDVKKVMIFGGNPTAQMLAQQLSSFESEVIVIERDRERCIELTESLPSNVRVVNGDGRNSDLLFEEGINDCDAFVALTDNDEVNVLACVVAKRFGVAKTIAEVENIEYINLAEDMGVDSIINKKLITAGKIFRFTLSGKARFVKYLSGSSAEVMEYTVGKTSAITKNPLKDTKFPEGAIVGGVIRGNESFIAVGDTKIEPYDRVAVFAMSKSIKEVDKLFK